MYAGDALASSQSTLFFISAIFLNSVPCNNRIYAAAKTICDMHALHGSRAGLKLEGALDHFGLDVSGMRVLDAGLSTGGFTDCLLQRGASHVIGVDVGYGQVSRTCLLATHPLLAAMPNP